MFTKRYVRVTKLEDTKFGGNHPNGIYAGYAYQGYEKEPPKVGDSYIVGGFGTSTVTEILENDQFRTLNSVYQITELKDKP